VRTHLACGALAKKRGPRLGGHTANVPKQGRAQTRAQSQGETRLPKDVVSLDLWLAISTSLAFSASVYSSIQLQLCLDHVLLTIEVVSHLPSLPNRYIQYRMCGNLSTSSVFLPRQYFNSKRERAPVRYRDSPTPVSHPQLQSTPTSLHMTPSVVLSPRLRSRFRP
jgi:hypothetical protein